ncbi:MAG: acyl-CoA carboxylase subunit beta [Methanomassiliicoccales archaeon]|nr:acyl-CoA carboxylase subunit beta [Methanomassiliicoccales archaeon]
MQALAGEEANKESKEVKELKELRRRARAGGGSERIDRQHKAGKMTARERIEALVDPGSFVELDAFLTHQSNAFGMDKTKIPGDGVVTGYGTVDGKKVYVFAQDFTVFAGSVGKMHASKICKTIDLAAKNGCPVIGMYDSGGARVQEGIDSLAGYAEIFFRISLASGVVPIISMIMGPCAGPAVFFPGLSDFNFMVRGTSQMFVVAPDVIKAVQNVDISIEDLGGAEVHNTKSGSAHFMSDTEADCLRKARRLLTYLPSNNLEGPPQVQPKDSPERIEESLNAAIPEDKVKPVDMHLIIGKVFDDGEFLEVQETYAQNIIVGFARLDGITVGIVANHPSVLAGTLDSHASIKAARFVRFCDAFGIPLVTFVDVPGYLPSVEQETLGMVRNSAKLMFAYCEATVPKITLVLRKAFGGAYCVMASKHIRADINYAWPSAEIAIMAPEQAIDIVYKRELILADDPQSKRDELATEYRRVEANAFVAAEKGYLDDVFEPKETRVKLINALHTLERKRETRPAKKHGNMPL